MKERLQRFRRQEKMDEMASDLEDEDDDEEGDEDGEDVGSKAWGKRKQAYYDTDYVDDDLPGEAHKIFHSAMPLLLSTTIFYLSEYLLPVRRLIASSLHFISSAILVHSCSFSPLQYLTFSSQLILSLSRSSSFHYSL